MTDTTTSGWVCSRCSTTMDASAAFCRGCGAAASSGVVQAVRARSSIGVPATLGRRFGAYAIDISIGAGIGLAISTVFGLIAASMLTSGAYDAYVGAITFGSIVQNIVALAWGVYYVASVGGRGSPGMRLLGLRLVMYTTEEAPGFWRVVLRNIVLSLTTLIVVGPLSPLFDATGQNRGWHDLATDTWMLDTRSAGAVRPATTVREVPAPTSSVAVVADLDEPVVPRTPAESSVPPAAYSAPAAVAPATAVPAAYSAPAVAPASFSAPPAGVISAVPGSAAPARPTAPAHEPEDLELTRMSAGAPAQPRPRAVRLRFDDGTVVVVSDTALVGRNPTPRTGEAAGELVALADTTRSISKTHARLEFLGDELSVIDRHSTNGTGVVIDGTATPVPPGGRAAVPVGATLTFGDRTAAVEWA
ncbi:RDD family protein [Rathayibacter festucae]|uniref:RDD family protein n=1 Tax=Rathayibacter festucae TaxID=110937 RepID=UPI002A6A5961|nr:RDD family protein [Rathayibacter festucae]MDY0915006.1 RDD family protein [Rathayibacter festucae]